MPYNICYTCIDTHEWKYVGEAGAEVQCRNSHTLAIITVKDDLSGTTTDSSTKDKAAPARHALVLYGGASPESGLLSDDYYATLPSDLNEIGESSFFVNWLPVITSPSQPRIGGLEMHGSVVYDGSLIITGGRSEEGMSSATWSLECKRVPRAPASPSSSQAATVTHDVEFTWRLLPHLALPLGRCSHSCALWDGRYLCVFGGFTSDAQISGDLLLIDLASQSPSWTAVTCQPPLEPRFGATMSITPSWYPSLTASISTSSFEGVRRGELLIYGGVDADRDFDILQCITPP